MAKFTKKPARKNPITDQPDDAPIKPAPAQAGGEPPAAAPDGPAFPLSEPETWTAARVFYAARQELHQHQNHPWVAVSHDHQVKFVEDFRAKWLELATAGNTALLEDWLLVSIVGT